MDQDLITIVVFLFFFSQATSQFFINRMQIVLQYLLFVFLGHVVT